MFFTALLRADCVMNRESAAFVMLPYLRMASIYRISFEIMYVPPMKIIHDLDDYYDFDTYLCTLYNKNNIQSRVSSILLNGGAMETERADFLVRGAKVYNSYFKKFVPADVSVSGGKFLYIDSRRSGAVEADETVDAEGLYMVPGLIDIHMHIESSMLTPGAFCRRLAE